MKKQIRRFSPHQTAKVIAVLMAVTSALFLWPMMLFMGLIVPGSGMHGGPNAFPMTAFWLMPLLYLIFTYLSVAIGCLLYNLLYRVVGGIEVTVDE
ncbi:MAG: hypothetical protein R3175_08180 [Marinobacter sp.]|uniref:hypothetical protein n=1 Tax=Marinobacter sp. TaxID=50741 RepID=UPI00299CD495|nr:hypothetical protein [Marinobacter sp.]MDX1756018.1 hypothetical protein [Marinobacter sp.]